MRNIGRLAPAATPATLKRSALLRTTREAQRPSPSLFYLPGLTSKPFWDTSTFPWYSRLLESQSAILSEYKMLSASKPSDYGTDEDHKLHEGTWAWHSLVTKGKVRGDAALSCPITSEFLFSSVGEDLLTDVPFAYAFFSTLHSNATISSHHGPCNIRLRCHLPLLVPEINENETTESLIGMKVGGKTVKWEIGKPLLFDDTYEHEVWNKTRNERVVLLFDVWHPDLSIAERESIAAMFGEAKKQGWLS